MSGVEVVDASLAVAWALPEVASEKARTLLVDWMRQDVRPIAPNLFMSEVNAALLRRRRLGQITVDEAYTAQAGLQALVEMRSEDATLFVRAFQIADRLLLRKAYDSLYAALAEREGCELWTGDERFSNAARGAFPWIHWVGEMP